MNRRQRIVFLLTAIVLLTFACYFVLPREPVHRGKRFSVWVEEFDRAAHAQHFIFLDPSQVDGELRPFREMGAIALPPLLKMIQAKDSHLKARMMEWSEKQSLVHLNLRAASQQRNLAVLILQEMGPSAHSAGPSLARL